MFEFNISHFKASPAIVWVLENNVQIFVGHYYEVVNGPIDMEWLANYNEKHRGLYDK